MCKAAGYTSCFQLLRCRTVFRQFDNTAEVLPSIHCFYMLKSVISDNTFFCVVRKGDLWWHDLNYTVDQVCRHGVRPVMWADAVWTGREEFVRRASREILMSNWYYRDDFSEKKQRWDTEFEKRGGWGETRNGLAGFLALEEGGFDQLPCGSNWNNERNMGLLVDFCRKRIDPSRLKGFLMAPFQPATRPAAAARFRAGIDLLAAEIE